MSLCACLDIMDDQIQRYAYNNPGKILVSEEICKNYLDEQNSEVCGLIFSKLSNKTTF